MPSPAEPTAPPATCAEIASRDAGRRPDVAQVRIATETYDAVDWFDGHTTPIGVEVHATCPVPAP